MTSSLTITIMAENNSKWPIYCDFLQFRSIISPCGAITLSSIMAAGYFRVCSCLMLKLCKYYEQKADFNAMVEVTLNKLANVFSLVILSCDLHVGPGDSDDGSSEFNQYITRLGTLLKSLI